MKQRSLYDVFYLLVSITSIVQALLHV